MNICRGAPMCAPRADTQVRPYRMSRPRSLIVQARFRKRGFRCRPSGDLPAAPVGKPVAAKPRRSNHHPAFQSCSNEVKLMKSSNLNLISRTALLIVATLSIAFAAGCATEPENNANTPTTASPAPSTSASPAGPTTTAPVNTASPVASPSPAASPSPKAKTKTGGTK